MDKFNSAISNGGPALLVKLIQNLTGIQLDHYVSMDLEGFKNITNAVGGVNVCITTQTQWTWDWNDAHTQKIWSRNTDDPWSGFKGHAGTFPVNGDQALAFVRQRHGLPNGDIDRAARQQQFIRAVFETVKNHGVLTSPIKLEKLLSAATSALTLDNHTSMGDLRKLATRLHGVATGSIRTVTLPTHSPTRAENAVDSQGDIQPPGYSTPISVQIYRPADLEKIVAPLGGHAEGFTATSPPTGTAASPAAAAIPPSQVAVTVYNGTAISGLASRTAAALAAQGFHATINAAPRSYVTSRVIYGTGEESAARTVQAAVPGSRLQADPTVPGIELVVGSSFTEVTSPGTPIPATSTRAAPATPAPAPLSPPAPTCTY